MAAPKNFHTLPYPISTRWLWPETFSDYLCFMVEKVAQIDSAPAMIAAIRQFGVLPFFHNTIEGWSVEELTKPGCWFSDIQDGGTLGPWDWKIDAVREGDILYGKFISNKAAFATVKWYRHFMNWRRSLPRMRMALGEEFDAANQMDRLAKYLSPTLLSEIQNSHSIESSRVKTILSERIPEADRMKIGGCMQKYLFPTIKKTACDSLLIFLEMGTWTVIGDFEKVYRGPNLEYKGWQRSTLTTPEEILGSGVICENEPSWVRQFLRETHIEESNFEAYSPTDSFNLLVEHVMQVSGCPSKLKVERLLTAHI